GHFSYDNYDGAGVYTWADGNFYDGNFKNGASDGFGKRRYANGNYYEGYWQADKKNGNGKLNYKNGDVYEGSFYDDLKNGNGIFTWATGEKYNGGWRNDFRDGRGKMMFGNGDEYNGDWKEDSRNGVGTTKFKNGDVYEGGYYNAQKHGKGMLNLVSGESYNGNWKYDKKDGDGIMKFVSGATYEGSFVNDEMEGKGMYKYANGDVYTGFFSKGAKQGKGLLKYNNNDWYEGDFANDKLNGNGKFMQANGATTVGEFVNGKMHGNAKRLTDIGLYEEGFVDSAASKLIAGKIWLLDGSYKEGSFDKKTNALQGYGKEINAEGKLLEGKFANNKLVEKLSLEQYEKKYGQVTMNILPIWIRETIIVDSSEKSLEAFLSPKKNTDMVDESGKKSVKLSLKKMPTKMASMYEWNDGASKLFTMATGKSAKYLFRITNNEMSMVRFTVEKSMSSVNGKQADKKSFDTATYIPFIKMPTANNPLQWSYALGNETSTSMATLGKIVTASGEEDCLWLTQKTGSTERKFCFVKTKGLYSVEENGLPLLKQKAIGKNGKEQGTIEEQNTQP
ncbi:MAG: hypothetical protein H7178_10285, partial [Chitinophagaceae bacterium]|nr:hypothetical protein [Chitinophagaceae bacterium]